MNDQKLRASLIRLAHAKPELRAEILPLLKQASAKKTAGIGTMQVGYIKNDALDLVDAVKDQEGIEITFLQLLDSCTAFARLGLHNTAVSALLDKAVNILAESEGNVLDTTGGPSRTRID